MDFDEYALSTEIIRTIILGQRQNTDTSSRRANREPDLLAYARDLICSDEFFHSWTITKHLELIHEARLRMVQHLLPPARRILDLGGANAPLHNMSYPHLFDEIVLVDLPKDQRHEMYQDIVVSEETAVGRVTICYGDMTELKGFSDASFDLVWSGQSIEHVPREGAERMIEEAHRVLKQGGWFCLDTPNGLITSIHARTAGLKMIHPEHFEEYRPEVLRKMLEQHGFRIEAAYGIREMPATTASGRFDYSDFWRGRAISRNLEASYIQFYACIKP